MGDSNKLVESQDEKEHKGWAIEMAQCIKALAAKPGKRELSQVIF